METIRTLDAQTIWEGVLESLKKSIPETNFKTWFVSTHALHVDKDKTLTIGVPNEFVKNWIQQKYMRVIIGEIQKQTTNIKLVRFTINRRINTNQSAKKKIDNKTIPFQFEQVDKNSGLNPRFNFDSFVIAPYIDFAHSAAQAVIKRLGVVYNPLFIYGPTGVGKTHLTQALGNKVLQLQPNLKVHYTTAENFTQDYVDAVGVGHERVSDFRKRYQSYQLLIIDDVHFFAGKERTTIELFHLFNHFYNNNNQIIFSSDRPPSEIPSIEERIRSRFASGMIVDIQVVDSESLSIIFKKKIENMDLVVEDEIVDFVVKNINGNVRELDSVVKNIMLYNEIHNKQIKLSNIKNFIKSNLKAKINITHKDVIQKVCSFYDIDPSLITTKSRKKEMVLIRQIIMYILREFLNTPYSSIGKHLGNRDHTTVMYACDRVSDMLENDVKIISDFNNIKRSLNLI